MKIISYLFMSLLFVNSILAQECQSDVTIQTNLPDSFIYVDNILVGNGEVVVQLTQNEHYIKIKDDEYKWDAEIIKDTIIVNDCNQDIILSYSFTNRYFIDSEPQDAFVYKNDLLIGHTPLFVQNGVDNILLSKKDYENRLVYLKDIPLSKKVILDFSGIEKSKSFADTYWFEIFIGTAVALGTTAAYFKIQADREYNKYIETNDKKYLDKTNQLDLYSGIAFGALQVNFGLLIYKLLSD